MTAQPLPEKALSIRQPWAWAILTAGKDIENRGWWTNIRGPICIHASKSMTKAEYEDCLDTVEHVGRLRQLPDGVALPPFNQLQRGGIFGIATIIDCVDTSESPWFFGKFGFVLSEVKPVPFIPVKGALGFFNWRKNLTTDLAEQYRLPTLLGGRS